MWKSFYFLVGICCLLFYLVVGSKLFVFFSWHSEDGIWYFTTWYLVFDIKQGLKIEAESDCGSG